MMQSSKNRKVLNIRQMLRTIFWNDECSHFPKIKLMNLKWLEIVFSFLSGSHPLG